MLSYAKNSAIVALPDVTGVLNVLLVRTAVLAIPPVLDEAAISDGANAWQANWLARGQT